MGWDASGGILAPTERPDHQIPPLTVILITIEPWSRTDVLVNPGVKENPDFASLPFAKLRVSDQQQQKHA